MTAVLLVAQLEDDAPPGHLAAWAKRRGLALQVVRPDRGEPLPDPAPVAGVVVLGSDQSVARPTAPWDPPLRDWVGAAHAAGVPVLGICFGAQLLAAALGGTVRRADGGRSELGWIEVVPADPDVPAGPWLGWHEDVIDPPAGAEVLARNAIGVQAFRAGASLGVQFHPEATPEIADDWASVTDGRRLAQAGIDRTALAAASAALAPAARAAAHRLFDAWAARAGLPASGPVDEGPRA